jgi:TRAP-type C4-dicarboxylate transport system substrate-binding protein
MFCRTLFLLATILVLTCAASGARAATTVIKIGTLAPQDSPWGKEFKKWATEVSNATNGQVQLDFQWNGQGGDEVLMVQKIRSGQLDGAAITAIGLAQTGVTDVLAFQLPGLFAHWSNLDAARNAMKDDLNREFESKGFTVLGWGDVGAAKTMSVGFEIHRPADLQKRGCYFLAGDPIGPKLLADIGGISPHQVQVPEILPGLTNGSITVLTVPPLAAEQLQWASRVTHMNTLTTAYGIGATIMSTARLQALPQSVKDAIDRPGREMQARLADTIRRRDAESFERMKKTKVIYQPTDAEQNEWRDLFARVRKELRGSVFTPAFLDRIEQLAGTNSTVAPAH